MTGPLDRDTLPTLDADIRKGLECFWLFQPPDITPARIWLWWEQRRLIYNAIVLGTTIFSFIAYAFFLSLSGHLSPGEDLIEPIVLLGPIRSAPLERGLLPRSTRRYSQPQRRRRTSGTNAVCSRYMLFDRVDFYPGAVLGKQVPTPSVGSRSRELRWHRIRYHLIDPI